MKDFTQKLQNSHLMRDKSKISSFEEIHHVASNENEFKIVNDLFVDNDSNSSSSNNFMSAVLFTHFAFSVAVSEATVC